MNKELQQYKDELTEVLGEPTFWAFVNQYRGWILDHPDYPKKGAKYVAGEIAKEITEGEDPKNYIMADMPVKLSKLAAHYLAVADQ